jgi:hypothetical protein
LILTPLYSRWPEKAFAKFEKGSPEELDARSEVDGSPTTIGNRLLNPQICVEEE